MDNAPGFSFNNGTVIADEDDAFFEVEREKFPSQYFFAGKFIEEISHMHGLTNTMQLLTVLLNYSSLAAPSRQLLHGGGNDRATHLHDARHLQN